MSGKQQENNGSWKTRAITKDSGTAVLEGATSRVIHFKSTTIYLDQEILLNEMISPISIPFVENTTQIKGVKVWRSTGEANQT